MFYGDGRDWLKVVIGSNLFLIKNELVYMDLAYEMDLTMVSK